MSSCQPSIMPPLEGRSVTTLLRALSGAVWLLSSACSRPDTGSPQLTSASAVTNSEGTDSELTNQGETSTNATSLPPCTEWLKNVGGAEMFEPPGVPNVSLDGVGGSLTLYASTLLEGPNGLELYAGICNDSQSTLCSAALQVEFFDHSDTVIGTASGAVQSGRLFSFSESPYPISCVAPGQTAMAALTELPRGLLLADLGSMGHRFPAFVIDGATPLAGVTVNEVEAVETAAGVTFRGVVTNDADSPVRDPEVSVFPITEAGRPLGNGKSAASLEMPPGGTWAFETDVVAQAGARHIAFAAAAFVAATPETQ